MAKSSPQRKSFFRIVCTLKINSIIFLSVLRACGAHLQMGNIELGEKLCTFARMGSKTKLTCYQLAGANLNTVNLSGQTALHAAIETGQKKIAQFLIQEKIDPFKKVTTYLSRLSKLQPFCILSRYTKIICIKLFKHTKKITFRIFME